MLSSALGLNQAVSETYLEQKAKGISAEYIPGTSSASRINPASVQLIQEAGIDISNQQSELLTAEILEYADWMLTIGNGVDWGA